MEKSPTNKHKQFSFELIAAIVMGILAIFCFAIQAITLNTGTTHLETVLFNLLQFLLTIGFAWFSGREVSRSEFEKSLKKYAIVAYRRITDIDKMLRRLHSEISDNLVMKPDGQENLLVLEAIVYDTFQVVQSSTDDWADVIGDELLAIEKIKRLEHQKDEIEFLEKTAGFAKTSSYKINEIENKIDELRSSLPAILKRSSQDSMEEEKFSPILGANWILNKHMSENGLVLKVVGGDDYSSGKKSEEINFNENLFITKKGNRGIDVVDSDGITLGRVLNITPLHYLQFQKAMELCYKLDMLPVEFLEVVDKYDRGDKNYIHYKIKINENPILGRRIRKKRETTPEVS